MSHWKLFAIAMLLVSVMLLLHALATTRMYSNEPVVLPLTENPQGLPDIDKLPQVTIKLDGSTYLGQEVMTESQLTALPRGGTRTVVLKADARAPFQSVRETIDVLSKYGVKRIYLLSNNRIRKPAS